MGKKLIILQLFGKFEGFFTIFDVFSHYFSKKRINLHIIIYILFIILNMSHEYKLLTTNIYIYIY